MAGEVVEGAAGGDDVDEAEQRGAQLGVLRGEVHRACRRARFSGLDRAVREGGGQVAPDGQDGLLGDDGHGPTIPTGARLEPGGEGAARIAPCGSPSPPTSAPGVADAVAGRAARAAGTSRCRTARWPTRRARRLGLVRRGGRPRRRRRAGGAGRRAAAGRAPARRSRRTRSPGVRAALCADAATAAGARRWNDANVLALSLRDDLARPSWGRSSTPGSRTAPSDDGGDAANVAHLDDIGEPRARSRALLIDARAAARPELGGVERWARELSARLPALAPGRYAVARPPAALAHRAGHALGAGRAAAARRARSARC